MQLWKRLELRPSTPKYIGNLNSKARAGYKTSHILITIKNIRVKLSHTAGLHRHIQWGWQLKDFVNAWFQLRNPKYTGDLTSKARVGYQTMHLHITSTKHAFKFGSYCRLTSPYPMRLTAQRFIVHNTHCTIRHIGDLSSKSRPGYQNPRYAQIWAIRIKATWPESF